MPEQRRINPHCGCLRAQQHDSVPTADRPSPTNTARHSAQTCTFPFQVVDAGDKESKQATWKLGKDYNAKQRSTFSMWKSKPPDPWWREPPGLEKHPTPQGRKEGSSFPHSASLRCSSEGNAPYCWDLAEAVQAPS